ncbi:hypothetical protein JCM11641_007872 [Rhodosporidiobolus odoratus]
MGNHLDPNHRRESYHSAPLTPSSAQNRRRRHALDAQKERRTHAIEAARSSFRELDFMEDLSLAGSDNSDWEQDVEQHPSLPSQTAQISPVISKAKRKAHKPKYVSWAKNLLTWPETLDLRHSLPEGLETEWRAVVCPHGKRCLVATSTEGVYGNTILYSRVAGRTLARLKTALPSDCLLDAVWDSSQSVLWVLDLMKWKGQFLGDCEAEMRAFFLSSKLSELPSQLYQPSGGNSSNRSALKSTLVLPVPSKAPPLMPLTLLPLLNSLAEPAAMPCQVLIPAPSSSDSTSPSFSPQTVQIPFQPEGLLLYLGSAHYESGSTPLVGWVPLRVTEEGMKEAEGVERLRHLIEEWESRGGEAAIALRGEEVQMDGA